MRAKLVVWMLCDSSPFVLSIEWRNTSVPIVRCSFVRGVKKIATLRIDIGDVLDDVLSSVWGICRLRSMPSCRKKNGCPLMTTRLERMPFSCTAPYPKSTDDASLRVKSCSSADDGAYPNRQTCVEQCFYDDEPPPPVDPFSDGPFSDPYEQGWSTNNDPYEQEWSTNNNPYEQEWSPNGESSPKPKKSSKPKPKKSKKSKPKKSNKPKSKKSKPKKSNKPKQKKTCAAGMELSHKTKRCLKACAPHQTRNPTTNRCIKR